MHVTGRCSLYLCKKIGIMMLLTLSLVIQGGNTTAMAILVACMIMPNSDPYCLASVYYNDNKGNE